MEITTLEMKMRHVPLIITAMGTLGGDKPIMLSYRMGKIREPLQEIHEELVSRIKAKGCFTDEGALRDDLSAEEAAFINGLVEEDVRIELPILQLEELDKNGVIATDDSAVSFLVTMGVIVAE